MLSTVGSKSKALPCMGKNVKLNRLSSWLDLLNEHSGRSSMAFFFTLYWIPGIF